jgi:AraC family transcriptional regulator of adaptative response/methylated-DNA-[protein]-cysteine methyltransferase
MLVATSPRGLCAVLLGDDPLALLADLRHRFPLAKPAADEDGRCARALQQLTECLASARPLPELALDLHGTPFQLRVWQALRTIPPGQTASYAQIATAIGAPAAARAVAGACAANPVAVLVPCHRVVSKDGSLSGYRWGLARKQALLAREGASRALLHLPA